MENSRKVTVEKRGVILATVTSDISEMKSNKPENDSFLKSNCSFKTRKIAVQREFLLVKSDTFYNFSLRITSLIVPI